MRRGGADRWIGARLPALATFAAAALLVVGIAGIGRIEVVAPDWQTGGSSEPLPQPTWEGFGEMEAEDPEDTPEPELPEISIPWEIALIVLLVVILAVVVVLLRRVSWRTRQRHHSTVVGGELEDVPDAAEELRRAVRTAGAALDRTDAAGHDAVIEAWQSLESAAAASGAPRAPSQTPSEFTEQLLHRHHADTAATTLLRSLYHRARFAVHPDISPADVADARSALTTILGTLDSPDRVGT